MFSNTPRNVYPYQYRAVVVDNNDPEKLGRVRLKIPEVFGLELVSDWASPAVGIVGPDGQRDKGDFHIPNIGDSVWCRFESGNPNYPIWTGVWYSKATKPPKLALGTEDDTVMNVNHATGTAKDPYAAKYPYNHVLKTLAGHVIEIDDTPGEERIKVFHGKSTFIDIDKDGNVRIRVVGNVYSEVFGDVSEKIHGNRTTMIEGDNTLYVQGEELRKSDTHIKDEAPRIDHN